jgi:pimeloyl-ACP methyl ester carboxylesterase
MSVGASQPDMRSDARHAPPKNRKPIRPRRYFLAVILLIIILTGIAWAFLRYDLRSYALLVRFADPQASGPILRWESYAVTSEDVSIPTANGPVPARLYLPVGVSHPRGMVAVHGIHHLGMLEPRLANFARAVAGSGLAVLTPQIDSLADYHVDGASIPIIGDSAVWLDQHLGQGPVSVTGISFAGGLSLLAACDPRYGPHIRSLALMGAYDDLARVSRFLATSQEELPDGTTIPHAAHDYGASVFVYAHLPQFFPAADLPAAHEALRDWLWEQPENAKPFLDKLSPASRATMDALLTRRIEVVRPRILEAIQVDAAELAVISPHGHLASLNIPVFILHGAADNIIPAAESMWMQQDVPKADLRDMLITGAFSHVDPSKDAPLKEKLRLVHFVGEVLRAAN